MPAPASTVFRQSALLGNPQANYPRSFHRFLDLPRELRDQVYLEAARDIQQVTFPAWEEELETWRPNLLNASSQVRAEAQEYILSECVLVIKLRRRFLSDPAARENKLVGVCLWPATRSFFDNLSDIQFAKIKRLRFKCQLCFLDSTSPYLYIEANVDLTEGQQGLRLTRHFRFGGNPPQHTMKTQISALRNLLVEICVRRIGKFGRPDLDRIVEAIGDLVHDPETPQIPAPL